MKTTLVIILLLLVAIAYMTGCASIANTAKHGGPNQLQLRTAKPLITTQSAEPHHVGSIPKDGQYITTVKRSDGLFNPNFYQITGEEEYHYKGARVNPMILGNILYPFGFLVDFATGAAWIPGEWQGPSPKP